MIFNPFIALRGDIKFAGLVAICIVSLIVAGIATGRATIKLDWPVLAFFALFAIMALRMNSLPGDPNFDNSKAYLRPFVCLFLFAAALFMARVVGVHQYAKALAVIVGIICLALLLNYRFLIAPRAYGPVGDFTFDSYQQVSTVFGITGLMFWFARHRHGFIAGFLICALVVAITPARGEQIAFVTAVLATTYPRAFIGIGIVAVIRGRNLQPRCRKRLQSSSLSS